MNTALALPSIYMKLINSSLQEHASTVDNYCSGEPNVFHRWTRARPEAPTGREGLSEL
jgi:hypothetical protein